MRKIARISTNVSERIFNISSWHGVNEAPEGEARLKLGEAAVMRNFCVTSGGALKKRPGSRNVAGLLAQYVVRERDGQKLLMTDTGLSAGCPMYPRVTADDAGNITAAGEAVTVPPDGASRYVGYYYPKDGQVYKLAECAVTPGTGSESVSGGRATPGALTLIASGTERWTKDGGSVFSGTRSLETRGEAYVERGAVNVRGSSAQRNAPTGTKVGFETTDVGGYLLRNGTLYRYYGARVDSYATGYNWKKYKCVVSETGYSYYTQSGWSLIASSKASTSYISGWSSYRFSSSTGRFTDAGTQKSIQGGSSGTVYMSSGSSCLRTVLSGSSRPGYSDTSMYESTAQGPYTGYDTSYSRGTYIGDVLVEDGARPEENRGYTYVTDFSQGGTQYTVMKNGQDYYCYAKDETGVGGYERSFSFHGYPLTVSPDTYRWYFKELYAAANESRDTVTRGIWSGFVGGREVLCAACGGSLWELKEENGVWTKISAGDMDTSRDVHMFGFDEKLYILNGEKYMVWDGERLSEVEGYRPLVSVSVEPSGGGTLLENVNRLTSGRRAWFSPDGSATVFRLPEKGLKSVDWVREVAEEGSPTPAIASLGHPSLGEGLGSGTTPASGHPSIGGALESGTTPAAGAAVPSVGGALAAPSYSVDLEEGTVTFAHAPEKGVNTVEIAWSVKEDGRADVCAMRFAELYNGAQDSRVFLYGDGTNRAFYSGLDHEGRPRADYFPDLYEVSVGDANTPVTAMIRHYNKLMAFKLDSAWSIGYDTITLTDGTVTAGFYVAPVNRSIGNCAYGQAQLVQNRPRTLDGRSVIEWKATSSSGITGDQRNAERVSQRVDNSIRRFDLAKARTFYDKFAHEYFVIGEDGTAIVQNLDVDAWYVYTGLDVTCMINYRDELYYGTRDGYLRHFSDEYFSDNGEAIDARWESGAMSFSEDFRRKYSAMVWIGIKPEDNGYLEVTAQTDRKSDFAVYDVESSNAAGVPEMERIKIKAKKFTYYKLILRNDTSDRTVTVVSADMRVRGSSLVK